MHAVKAPTALAATALVVAVLGSAPITHAAGQLILPKRSVGAAQIKKNAVTGAKVKNGTLAATDFRAGQLPAGPQGPKGDPGPEGRNGDKGDTGATGSPGLSGLEMVEETETSSYSVHNVTATCPDGKRAIAVAGSTSAPLGKVALVASKVVSNNAGWVSAQTINGLAVDDWSLTASVTCAYVQ